MKIVVCVKQVPDTNVTPSIDEAANWIDTDKISMVANPYDEYAVEEGLQILEDQGDPEDHEMVILLIGPSDAEEILRKALAMGEDYAKRAIHVVDDEVGNADGHVVSAMIASILEDEDPDIVLFGNKAVDDGNAWVGPAVAERLGLPQVTFANHFEVSDGHLECTREIEGAEVRLQVPIPCVATVQKGQQEPRYPSLPGLMEAKQKPVDELTVDDLELADDALEPRLEIRGVSPPPEKQAGVKVEDPPEESVPQLVEFLDEEVQVI